ncbi:PEP-CTERM sorting domain-containing protein [Aeoliella mucimassa]|uniref:PEP-CTERM protein-sorting domain-containing protein n=1 Tax=Aeoliella mucimassa TaxID=2527972 RepID=A0A518AQJ8_9BACT|nr:PEP-CTERM sorting domain-containing protein [Aeoliella mucimassa]QDU56998.1 hypothetical protein Pan181_32100 [Aeoliella mucimassa]
MNLRKISYFVLGLMFLVSSEPANAGKILFTSDFDGNSGAAVLPDNTDNTTGSSTVTINDWSLDSTVSTISDLTAISTGDSGTLGGFAQLGGGDRPYANPDNLYLSRNHNTDSDRSTSQRGYSLDFTLDSDQELIELTVVSGHTNNTALQDQAFASDLVFELSGGSLASSITGVSTEDYGTLPDYHEVTFDLSGVALGAGTYTLDVYQTNMPGGGAYAMYNGITLEAVPEPGTLCLAVGLVVCGIGLVKRR